MSHDFRHLALYVNDLRWAETFYRGIFGMEILFREVFTPDDEWYTVRSGAGWAEAEAAGVDIAMVALQRDDVTGGLSRGNRNRARSSRSASPSLSMRLKIDRHLPDDATGIRHEHGDVYFAHPFGFRWRVTPAGTAFVSNAEIDGRWFDL